MGGPGLCWAPPPIQGRGAAAPSPPGQAGVGGPPMAAAQGSVMSQRCSQGEGSAVFLEWRSGRDKAGPGAVWAPWSRRPRPYSGNLCFCRVSAGRAVGGGRAAAFGAHREQEQHTWEGVSLGGPHTPCGRKAASRGRRLGRGHLLPGCPLRGPSGLCFSRSWGGQGLEVPSTGLAGSAPAAFRPHACRLALLTLHIPERLRRSAMSLQQDQGWGCGRGSRKLLRPPEAWGSEDPRGLVAGAWPSSR